MFLSSLIATLASVATVRLQVRGRRAKPDFDGVLEELFAVWPLGPEEELEARAHYAPH